MTTNKKSWAIFILLLAPLVLFWRPFGLEGKFNDQILTFLLFLPILSSIYLIYINKPKESQINVWRVLGITFLVLATFLLFLFISFKPGF